MSHLGIVEPENISLNTISNIFDNKEYVIKNTDDTDTIMLIIIVVFLALFFYYLFFDNKDNCGCNTMEAINSTITNLGIIAIITMFTATISAPGKLTKLYSDNKLFRFIYFYLVIYILADQSFHGGISHLYALVATVVILFIYDLLSEPGDGYTPSFFRRDRDEVKGTSNKINKNKKHKSKCKKSKNGKKHHFDI